MFNYKAENIWYAIINKVSNDLISFGNLYFGRELNTNHIIKEFETEPELELYIDNIKGEGWYNLNKQPENKNFPITIKVKEKLIAHERFILQRGWETGLGFRLSMDEQTYNSLMNILVSGRDVKMQDNARITIIDSQNNPRQIKFVEFKDLMFQYNQCRILFQMCYNKRIKEINSMKVI